MSSSNPLRPDFSTYYQQNALPDFFALSPQDSQAALRLEHKVDRARLAEALANYAGRLEAPKAVFDQLERLKHPDSRVVVTGQQAGLLLGPSFTLSKAITAIKLAKALSTEAKPVVPIFWVASQDHDTEEIDHSYMLDFDELLYRLDVDLPKASPAARIVLQKDWLERVTTQINAAHFHRVFRQEVIALLEAAAKCSESFSDWFAALLYRLLGTSGLVLIDPMQADIAQLFAPLLEQEIANPDVSVRAVNAAAGRLKALGFEPQLGRGEAATNLFIEEVAEKGIRRELLRFDGKAFYTEHHRYSSEDVLAKLERDPRAISPAAALRPISQDYILPTAVTVVGPGELRYFAQLKDVYMHHGVAMPLIWLRATATVLEPPVQRIMAKFSLSLAELSEFAKAKEAALLALHGHAAGFSAGLSTLESSLKKLTEEVKAIDPSLLGTVLKAEKHFAQTIEILKYKSARALAQRDDIYTQQFDRLEKHLFPDGIAQERLISPFSFFLKFGIEPVMQAFLQLPSQGEHAIRL